MTLTLPQTSQLLKDNWRVAAPVGAILAAILIYFLFFNSGSAEADQGGPPQGPPPANVVIDKIIQSEITPNFTAPGDIVANRDSVVAAEVPGRIIRTLPIGAYVKRGSVVAVIDDRPSRLARDQASAEIKRLQSDLQFQNRQVARLEQLLKEEAESEASLDEARSTRDSTRARLNAARVAYNTAAYDLQRTSIRAPFTGQMVERRIEVGEYATPGREVARIVGKQDAEARVRIPISTSGSMSAGQEVTILAGGTQRSSRIRSVVEIGDEVSRTLEVRAPINAGGLKIGSAISMTVPTGVTNNALTVKRDALVLRDSGIFVYVVDPKEKTAKRVTVTVGDAQGERIAVNGPIKAGDMVVIRGGERLRDGQPVLFEEKKADPKNNADKAADEAEKT